MKTLSIIIGLVIGVALFYNAKTFGEVLWNASKIFKFLIYLVLVYLILRSCLAS